MYAYVRLEAFVYFDILHCRLGPRIVCDEAFLNSLFMPILLLENFGISSATLHLAYQSVSLSENRTSTDTL